MIAPVLLLSLALPQDPAGGATPEPASLPKVELRTEDLEAWRAAIEPQAADLSFEEIPWLPTFSGGLLAADEQGKPLLFWAMNGHPLACT